MLDDKKSLVLVAGSSGSALTTDNVQKNKCATVFEIVALHSIQVAMDLLYKQAIDVIYSNNYKRIYHDFDFPEEKVINNFCNDEELKRIHEFKEFTSVKCAFEAQDFTPIHPIFLQSLKSNFRFFINHDDRIMCLDYFREAMDKLDFEKLIMFLHENFYLYIFPEDYEDLSEGVYEFLHSWFDYFLKVNIKRIKSDLINNLAYWLDANLFSSNQDNQQLIGISDEVKKVFTTYINSTNPIQSIKPTFLVKPKEYIVSASEINIKFI